MISVKDIAYVRFTSPDLDAMQGFMADFGMQVQSRTDKVLYMRGSGTAPFVHVTHLGPWPGREGIGMWAQSVDDLHRLADEQGTRVEACDEPGGGKVVHLVDPAGMAVDVHAGQDFEAPLATRGQTDFNFGGRRNRGNLTQRFKQGPSTVSRLGHVVMRVPSFKAVYDWYTGVLGMKLSDGYYAGHESNMVMAFLHCGLGSTLTDHHTVAFIELPAPVPPGIDHSAFEVLDFDDLMVGNEHLKKKGYAHAWGVGRHVEGSQIFDYWRDPNGVKIEHWTDGDAVNDDYVSGLKPMLAPGEDATENSNWAPPMTPEFFK